MTKIDYRKEYHELYSPPSDHTQQIAIPAMQFAMVDGQGTPESPEHLPEFQNAISALYGITYTLKIGRKRAGIEPDYTIGPLEGLWWMADGGEFDAENPAGWRWTLMLFQPDFITTTDFMDVLTRLKAKRSNPALDLIRLETFSEGQAVQIMHIGPYAEEARSMLLLDDYAGAHGYKLSGKHHEIYLGDPRRTRPEKLRTILRRPITRIA